jgi:OmpA-OmpF porin, OOP family
MGSLRCRFASCSALALAFITTFANADPLPSVDVRHFNPSTAPDSSLYLESALTPGAGKWNVGSWISWAHRPVVLRDADDEVVANLVGQQLSLDLLGSVGITNRAAIGLSIPAVLHQDGDSSPETAAVLGDSSLPGQALGDVALTGKVNLVPYEEMGGFGLAALARVTAPTGDRNAYVGEGSMTSELRLLAEYKLVAVAAQATAGFKLRTAEREFAGETWGNEIPWGVGLSLRPQALGWDDSGDWTWVLETHGALPAGPASPFTSAPLSPAIAGFSARYEVARDLSLVGGVEGPLDGAVGVPLVRVAAGITWAPRPHDMDHDAVDDDVDECPELAEDRDGFEDHDGCPDFDNDSDGTPDQEDRCPGEVEDLDDFQDEDGCIDPDNDRDGIADEDDDCPDTWGVRSDLPEVNGCPVFDRDNDGLNDENDKCPDEAEDKDGYGDDDGCPDPDNDRDGIMDTEDRCPLTAGPASSTAKWNGCPVPDEDGDTFDDEQDKCPSEAEVWNGVNDDDGCPDKGGMWQVREQDTRNGPIIQVRRPIKFGGPPGAPELDAQSLPTVRAIATILNRHPHWVLAVGCRPKQAEGPLAATNALSRSFALVLALRSFTFRDGVAETVGWEAVKDQPGALAHGVGLLVLAGNPDEESKPNTPPSPPSNPSGPSKVAP